MLKKVVTTENITSLLSQWNEELLDLKQKFKDETKCVGDRTAYAIESLRLAQCIEDFRKLVEK